MLDQYQSIKRHMNQLTLLRGNTCQDSTNSPMQLS